MLVIKNNVSPRRTGDQRRGRIKAHRFLDDLICVYKIVDVVGTNRTTSRNGGNFASDPLLDLGVQA